MSLAFYILQHQMTDFPEYLLTRNLGRTCRPSFYCRIVTVYKLTDLLLSIMASRTRVISSKIFIQLIFLTDKTPLLKNLDDLKHPQIVHVQYTKDISSALSDQDSVDESNTDPLQKYRYLYFTGQISNPASTGKDKHTLSTYGKTYHSIYK